MIFTWFIVLSKNNNKKKVHRALALTILSLSVVSLIITMSALNYSSAQVSDSQNATTLGSVPSAASMNTTSPTTTSGGQNQSTTAEVRILIEQARMAVQNNDIQGALMNLNSSLVALEGGGNDEQGNKTATTPNEVTDSTTTTEAGTIGSGGAGGAGTAGGIMTGSGT